RHEPCLNFTGDLQIALHGDFVSQLQSQQEQEKQRREELKSDFKMRIVGKVELKSRENQQEERDQEDDTQRRRKLVKQGKKEAFGNVQGSVPPRKFVDFVPIDVAAIESVASARICTELGPKFIEPTAFADTAPEICVLWARRRSRVGR